jgi:hypothetical protein
LEATVVELHVLVRLGVGTLIAAAVIGCAQERDPINRVQANAAAKSFFVGDIANPDDDPEFYASTTVVDVPYGVSAPVFTGSTGSLRRAKWEITEKQLNLRLTYETIEDVDGKGSRTTNTGQVIASFDIESHFDIKRDYNPQTGEELNIVVENTTDRPWFDRDYFRVDWSSNKLTGAYSFDPLASLKLGGDELEPLSYRVDKPGDPDAPVFDVDRGYFDITNKVYVKPTKVGDYPSCYYYAAIVLGGTYPYGSCDPAEIKLRLSFLRIAQPNEPGDRDYEIREWDGARFNAHGAFVQDRLGYDQKYGVIDAKWHRFIQRYNIWDKSHLDIPCAAVSVGSDVHADRDGPAGAGDGTEDACHGAPAGSRCDDLSGRCTIPYARREVRTNPWHFNLAADDEIAFDSTERAAEEWDTAMRIAVQSARLVECKRTAGASLAATRWEKEPSCEKAFPVDQGDDVEVENVRKANRCRKQNGRVAAQCAPDNPNSVAAMPAMIALCHNPVRSTDDPMCGQAGLVTRPGDLRYHQVNVIPSPQTASPWGYGPSNADPLTGEVIQASINVWNSVTDQTAQLIVDQVRWINGELPTDEITSGNYVEAWAQAASAHVPGSSPLLTRDQIDSLVVGTGAVSKDDLARAAQVRANVDVAGLRAKIAQRAAVPSSSSGTANAAIDARMALAEGTPTEAALTGPMWLEMTGTSAAAATAANTNGIASPLRALSGAKIVEAERQVQKALAEHGQCLLAAPEPTGIVPLAKVLSGKFPYDSNATAAAKTARVEKMWNYIRGKLNYSVIAHEMGHTIGLRHNFGSSYDKFNYRPQYWQLRTRGGTVVRPCTGPETDGSQCVGPRYYDPLDQDEIDQMIWMWSQTSVMDYAGDTTQDTLGLGVYDYAATRAFYADLVDVRSDGVKAGASGEGNEMFGLVDTALSPLSQTVVDRQGQFVHYSQWNNFFHLLRNCRPVDDSAPSFWDKDKNGEYSPAFDGHIVRKERCERMPVDYVDWRDMVPDVSAGQINYDPRWIVSRRAQDKQGRPRMPYISGPDEYAEGGNPAFYQHDNGADIYEEMVFHDNLYEDRHIFDNFRRGRVTFSLFGAYQRSVSRYHQKMRTLAQAYSLYHDYLFHDLVKDGGISYADLVTAYEGEGGYFRDYAIASALAFDHFTRVLSRPQPGPHQFFGGEILKPVDWMDRSAIDVHPVDIPQGSSGVGQNVTFGGRPIQNSFVSSQGYWNVSQAGSYYEKTHAVFDLLAAYADFPIWSREEGIDARWTNSNFANLYPDGVRRLLGILLTEDQALYAPRVAIGDNGLPVVKTDSAAGTRYPAGPLGWVSFVPPGGPAVCWPGSRTSVCTDAQGNALDPSSAVAPRSSAPIDPELGFEVQKFVVFYSYVFLPAIMKFDWVDMMRIYQLGASSDPSFGMTEAVQWTDPQTGLRYLAKRYGAEQIFDKTYDKGIGAKMLQWANHLSSLAYVPKDVQTPFDPVTGAFTYATDPVSGQPVVAVDPDSRTVPSDPNNVKCDDNRYCVQLRNYRGLIDFARDTAARLGFPAPALNGIYAAP